MKKKSMSTLANLAPRRRNKGNNKDPSTEVRETTIPPVPVRTNGPDHPKSLTAPGNQDSTVDRLASALLESTIFNHPNGLASHPSVLICGTEPVTIATTSTPEKPKATADSRNPIFVFPLKENLASTQSFTHSSEADQTAPAIPRKSSRRRAKRSDCGEASADKEKQALMRSFPQSKTTMLDTGKRQAIFLPESTTVPLGGLTKQGKSGMVGHDFDPNMVDDKVAAMLAATEALKPRGSQVATPTSSKTLRFRRKKVMSKVRHALDMFQSKSTTPDSKIRGKISAPIALTTCNIPNPATHYHLEEVEEASPVTSMEIRLNEGVNLNNHKVQSIVGGCILRKPIPDDGRSLDSGRSSEEPFSEAPFEIVRTPTPFEHRLKISTDSSNIPPVPSLNPFDSEKDFDADLEGILSEEPLCASTPRSRTSRKAVPLNSPSRRDSKAEDGCLTPVDEAEGDFDTHSNTQRKLKLDLEAIRLSHDGPDLSMKKHPSPNKDDLDDLETQFRAYAIAQIHNAPAGERDALTTKFAGLIGPNALTMRDKNIPMKARSTKEEAVDEFSAVSENNHTRESSVTSTRHSRIPRPVEPATKSRSTPRFACHRQPTNSDAMEIDELQ